MACNCNEQGKVYNISMGCCVPVVANPNAYYTKSEVDQKLDDIVISGGGVTSGVVESMIDDAMEYKQDVLTAGEYIEIDEDNIISVTGGAFTIDEQLDSASTNAVANSAITKAINDVTESIPTVPTDVSAFRNDVGYLTEHQPIKTINNLSLIGEGNIEIPTVPTKVSAFENDVPYLTQHQSLSGYATEQWVLDKHYISGVDLSDYTTKEYVSGFTYDKATIDEKVAGGGTFDPTQYYNKTQTNSLLDEKLDTSAYTPTDLSEYWTSAQTQSAITQAVNGKADSSAVTQSIDAAVSGKADTTYVANNFMSKSSIWCGTEQQWAQISGNPQSDVIYMVY